MLDYGEVVKNELRNQLAGKYNIYNIYNLKLETGE